MFNRRPWRMVGLLVLVAALPGCLTRSELASQVSASRAAAFSAWRGTAPAEETQQVLAGELDLAAAVDIALANNKALRAAKQAREAARGQLWAAYSNALPRVELNGSYTRLDIAPSFSAPGLGSIPMGDNENYAVAGSVTQPIFRGGAIPAAIRGARILAVQSEEQVRGAVQNTIFLVARAYYDVLLAEQLAAVAEEAVASAKAHLEDVQRKREHGVAANFDVLRAQTELSLSHAELIQRRNRVHVARSALYKAMGISQQSDVRLTGQLEFRRIEPDFVKAVETAYAHRPDLAQAELEVRAQQEALQVVLGDYWPRIEARYSHVWAKPDPHDSTRISWGRHWEWGLTARLTLFDGLTREGKLIQTRAHLRRSQLQLVDTEEQAIFEIQRAILNLKDAEEFVESQRMNLQRAEESLRLAKVGYREGVNTEVEVIDARTAYTRARSLYYQAVYDHIMAKLDLQHAMGVMGPPFGSREVQPKGVVPGEMDIFPSDAPVPVPPPRPEVAPEVPAGTPAK